MSSNLHESHTGPQLLKASIEYLFASLAATIPITILFLLILTTINYGTDIFTLLAEKFELGKGKEIAGYKEQFDVFVMVLAIVLLPLMGMYFTEIHHRIESQAIHFFQILGYVCSRFLSLIGTFISISLLPMFILLLSIGAYFLLLFIKIPVQIFFFAPWVLFALLLLSIIPKLFSVVLVFTEKLDANSAIEKSITMVKGYYWRTVLYALFAISILLFIGNFEAMGVFYFTALKSIPTWWFDVAMGIALFFALPWSCSLWVCHERDLFHRLQNKIKADAESKEVCKDLKAKVTLTRDDNLDQQGF